MDKFDFPEHKGSVYVNFLKKTGKYDVYIKKITHSQPRYIGTAGTFDEAKELGIKQLSTFGRM